MKAAKNIMDSILRVIMAVSSFVLFAVTFMQVVWRFVLSSPLPWSQDVIRLCFTYLVFVGAAYCVRDNAHLGIDFVLSMLKPRLKQIVELLINVLLIGFFVFLAYYGFVFAQSGSAQMAPYLPIKMSYYYASVPVSAVLMIFYGALQVAEQVKALTAAKTEGR